MWRKNNIKLYEGILPLLMTRGGVIEKDDSNHNSLTLWSIPLTMSLSHPSCCHYCPGGEVNASVWYVWITRKILQRREMLLFLYLHLTLLIIKKLLSFIFWSLAVLVTIAEGKSPVIHKEETLFKGPTARADLWIMLIYTEMFFPSIF